MLEYLNFKLSEFLFGLIVILIVITAVSIYLLASLIYEYLKDFKRRRKK